MNWMKYIGYIIAGIIAILLFFLKGGLLKIILAVLGALALVSALGFSVVNPAGMLNLKDKISGFGANSKGSLFSKLND
jgi:O-antigen ligase